MAQHRSVHILHSVPAEAPPAALRPRETRYRVMLAGLIARAGSGQRLAMTVRNISAHGLEAETAYPPDEGDLVDILLPRLGRVTGRIRWGRHGRVGIELTAPIDPKLAFVRTESSVILHHDVDCRRPPVVWKH